MTKSLNEAQYQHYFANCQSVSTLNERHDRLMQQLINDTLQQLGEPPCPFTVFITGSGGRKEQGFLSDQDHGLIYSDDAHKAYFHTFGQVFSDNLATAGYVYCEGGIMTSNPQWNASVEEWQQQLKQWLQAAEWSHIRYTQIFYDARILYGSEKLLKKLKTQIDHYISHYPYVLQRFTHNIMHLKPALGPLGQLLPERYGEHQGEIDLKYSAFLPYINCVRLVALEHHVHATSTQERITVLATKEAALLQDVALYFDELLRMRFQYQKPEKYKDTHYISLQEMSLEDKRMLKKILKRAKRLHDEVIARYA